jgi:hypothetical protein
MLRELDLLEEVEFQVHPKCMYSMMNQKENLSTYRRIDSFHSLLLKKYEKGYLIDKKKKNFVLEITYTASR